MDQLYYEKILNLSARGESFVTVTLVESQGSVPQEVGARMIVAGNERLYGTVGGGKVEKRALDFAMEILESPEDNSRIKLVSWALDKDIGMTCGGSVKLLFESHRPSSWSIVVFGAGHCALALIDILSGLDCRITCVDTRAEWLAKLPASPRIKAERVEKYEDYVGRIDPASFVVLMTMGHSTDSPVLISLLKRFGASLPYIGVIGSKAKAQRLKGDLKAASTRELDLSQHDESFYCPVGLPIGSRSPEEIAVSVAAQLLMVRDGKSGCL